jgi:hypothetical protein
MLSRTRRARPRSPTFSRLQARMTRCSRSRSAPSSARRGHGRTGLPTPITRISSERRARRTGRRRRSGGSAARAGSKRWRRGSAKRPSCGSGIRRSRRESSPASATRRSQSRRFTNASRASCTSRACELQPTSIRLTTALSYGRDSLHTCLGGSALVRWRIQTPSVIAVLSAANRRGRSSSELPLRPALCGHSAAPCARGRPQARLRRACPGAIGRLSPSTTGCVHRGQAAVPAGRLGSIVRLAD